MLSGNFSEITTSTPFRDLLHVTNLRYGTDGFTSPPKEGVLRIFSPLKIQRLRPGLNPRTWVLKAAYTEEIVKAYQMNTDALQNLPAATNNMVLETSMADGIPAVKTKIIK
jgi:hypothetical protein